MAEIEYIVPKLPDFERGQRSHWWETPQTVRGVEQRSVKVGAVACGETQ
jgi:hypothetical protein